MGFANPWLLLGLAALAAPVLIHLVRREERRGRGFPSLMFIRRIPFEHKSRRQLRDRVLLALRCLALAALVLAFAQPYTDADDAPRRATEIRRDIVWLLDRSYSMSPARRWEQAMSAVGERIDALAAGERATLVAFDDAARVVAGPTGDRAVLREALARIEPGEGGTGLAAAFGAVGRIFAAGGREQRQVVVVSDLQRSALDGGPLPLGEGVELEIVPVTGPVGANVAVLDVGRARGREPSVEETLSVRVRNTGDAPLADARVALQVAGRAVETRPLALAPHEEHRLDFPLVTAPERPTRVTVEAGPDALAADNRHHAVLPPRQPVAAALIEPDRPRAHHGVFLEEALRLARAPAVELRRVHVSAVDASLLDTLDVLILDDTALPSASAARAVGEFVSGGGGVLVVAGPSTGLAADVPDLFPMDAFGAAAAHDGADARIAAAPGEPLWAAVGLDRGRSLAGARVTTSRRVVLDPADRVLARLGDGAPLLIERARGAGRILALATTADPRWGTLALEPGFVPLAQAAVLRAAGAGEWRTAYTVGEIVDLRRHVGGLPDGADWRRYLLGGGAVVVEEPSGAASRVGGGEGAVFKASSPGIYEAHRADGGGAPLPFAVNASRSESMLAAASPDELRRSILRRSRTPAASPGTALETAGAAAARMPWWLLALGGLLLIAESLLAGRISQRPTGNARGVPA